MQCLAAQVGDAWRDLAKQGLMSQALPPPGSKAGLPPALQSIMPSYAEMSRVEPPVQRNPHDTRHDQIPEQIDDSIADVVDNDTWPERMTADGARPCSVIDIFSRHPDRRPELTDDMLNAMLADARERIGPAQAKVPKSQQQPDEQTGPVIW